MHHHGIEPLEEKLGRQKDEKHIHGHMPKALAEAHQEENLGRHMGETHIHGHFRKVLAEAHRHQAHSQGHVSHKLQVHTDKARDFDNSSHKVHGDHGVQENLGRHMGETHIHGHVRKVLAEAHQRQAGDLDTSSHKVHANHSIQARSDYVCSPLCRGGSTRCGGEREHTNTMRDGTKRTWVETPKCACQVKLQNALFASGINNMVRCVQAITVAFDGGATAGFLTLAEEAVGGTFLEVLQDKVVEVTANKAMEITCALMKQIAGGEGMSTATLRYWGNAAKLNEVVDDVLGSMTLYGAMKAGKKYFSDKK